MVWYDRDMKSKLEKIAIFIHWCAHLFGILLIIFAAPLFLLPSSSLYQPDEVFFVFGIFAFLSVFCMSYWGFSAIGGIIRFLLTGKFSLFPWTKHRFEKPVIWTICISVIYVVYLYASGFLL
tara:strand:- start:323 stop:688 length:366 start_codon:yes stop_codon:yes gene_type:complete